MTTDPRKDSELNRIISEWRGWHDFERSGILLADPPWTAKPPDQIGGKRRHIPECCTDLNACADVERKLDHNQLSEYVGHIVQWANNEGVCWTTRSYSAVGATARQRSEALVKVIEEERK